ncbi:hypothetical protein [Deinococcus pimensis]|uniref:hypothetical protein n=1 Tax=Deinococcus pimensis TaxID=309888 RepID=UPI0004839574|nr:hypothetical protein [Deinococcus pimensis]
MIRKTLNLISVSTPGVSASTLMACLPTPEVTHVDLTDDHVELVLPDASREATLRLARTLSERYPAELVRAHLRVNARWLPRVVSTGLLLVATHAHVVDVDVPAEVMIRTMEVAPPGWNSGGVHVQAVGRASQLVLPSRSEEELGHVTDWVKAHVGEPRVSSNMPGRWVANGSRHHDVERFRSGAALPSAPAVRWTDDD